jgi:hypothetical protein
MLMVFIVDFTTLSRSRFGLIGFLIGIALPPFLVIVSCTRAGVLLYAAAARVGIVTGTTGICGRSVRDVVSRAVTSARSW